MHEMTPGEVAAYQRDRAAARVADREATGPTTNGRVLSEYAVKVGPGPASVAFTQALYFAYGAHSQGAVTVGRVADWAVAFARMRVRNDGGPITSVLDAYRNWQAGRPVDHVN